MKHLIVLVLIANGVFLFQPSFSQNSVRPPIATPNLSPADTSTGSVAGSTELLEKAELLYEKKQYKEALNFALKSLDAAKKTTNSFGIYDANFLIAKIFHRVNNNFDKALEYFKNNLSNLNTIDDTKKSILFNNIGGIYIKLQISDSAENYLKKTIELKDNSKATLSTKGIAYANLASIKREKNQLIEAENYALKSLEINKKIGDSELNISYALANLGSIYMLQKKYPDAKKYFEETLTYLNKGRAGQDYDLKEKVLDNLSYTLYQLKDYNAYKYQEESYTIRDSIRDAEISGILSEIEGKYNAETVKKQEQLKTAEEKAKRKHAQDINIILYLISTTLVVGFWAFYRYLKLRHEKTQLETNQNFLIQQNELEKVQSETREKILNATIDGKESERKMIAETLHHSVSSLLSSASLHLQAAKMVMNGNTPEEISKAHTIINEAAEKIRNLSHSLVSSVLLKFGLKFALQDLCDKYSNTALQFSCTCDQIKRYDIDFELKINSIIDELLNNIIKHSQAKEANIILNEKNGFLDVSIIDNGKGFDLNKIGEKSGLGLKQIETRINKMKGVFTINTSSQKGTNIYISVPIPEPVNLSIEKG